MKFMPDAQDDQALTPASKDYRERVVEEARTHLARFVGRAVQILEELATTSENDRVRLAAVDSILDRAGVGKSTTQEVKVSSAEHEAATREAEDVMHKITKNRNAVQSGPVGISLDALIVHEGETAS